MKDTMAEVNDQLVPYLDIAATVSILLRPVASTFPTT
jgi:hypothetical protein